MKTFLLALVLLIAMPACAAQTELACEVGGCSNHLCVEKGTPGAISTCEYRAEYGCYGQFSQCGPQQGADGKFACAWARTPALEQCMQQAKRVPLNAPAAPIRNIQ